MLDAPEIKPGLMGRGLLGVGLLSEPLWRAGKLLNYYVLSRGGVQFAMQETSGVVVLATNPAVDLGRDTTINGTFATDTVWSKDGSWVIAGNAATHTPGTATDISQDGIVSAGSGWQLIFTVSGRTQGSITPKMGVSGTTRSTNSTFTQTIDSTSTDLDFTPSSDFDGAISAVTTQQVDIAASSAFSTPGDNPLDGANNDATGGVDAGQFLDLAYSLDGASSFIDISSAEFNSVFNPTQWSLVIFAKVSSVGVWTDGTARYLINLFTDGDNSILARKNVADNTLRVSYEAGGVAVAETIATSTTDWLLIAVTVNTGLDEMIVYFNDTEISNQSGLGDWSVNFSSAIIGAFNTNPDSVWDGLITQFALINGVLTTAEIARIARAGGVA